MTAEHGVPFLTFMISLATSSFKDMRTLMPKDSSAEISHRFVAGIS